MTSAQLAWRLMRHCTPSDPAALTVSQASELAGAMSQSLAHLFRHGPTVNRRTSASVILPEPTQKTITIAKGSKEVSAGAPFAESQRGSTIMIDGDNNLNEIVSTTELLNPYLGTGGEVSCTIYGDCVPIRTKVFEKLISDPWVMVGDGYVLHLTRARHDHDPAFPDYWKWDHAAWFSWRNTIDVGDPRFYAVQESGISRGTDNFFQIRVWPAPTREMVLRFEVDAMPDLFDHTNISQVPLDLPLSEAELEGIVLPLAEKNLLRSTLYQNISNDLKNDIRQAAMDAEREIQLLPRNHGIPRSRIRTKRGF